MAQNEIQNGLNLLPVAIFDIYPTFHCWSPYLYLYLYLRGGRPKPPSAEANPERPNAHPRYNHCHWFSVTNKRTPLRWAISHEICRTTPTNMHTVLQHGSRLDQIFTTEQAMDQGSDQWPTVLNHLNCDPFSDVKFREFFVLKYFMKYFKISRCIITLQQSK